MERPLGRRMERMSRKKWEETEMKHYTRLLLSVCSLLLLLSACSRRPEHPQVSDRLPAIYPDYIGVTIPAGVAPLNFNMADERADRVDVVVKGSKGGELHANGRFADFDIADWRALTEQNVGGRLTFTVCARSEGKWTQYKDFTVEVSAYPLDDYGLTYRRIPPGYEVGGNIGVYQRDIHSFDETPLLQESAVPGRCFNCHTPNRTDPRWLTIQIRGEGGGTMVQVDGVQRWLDTKTDSTKAACSYAYWHPSVPRATLRSITASATWWCSTCGATNCSSRRSCRPPTSKSSPPSLPTGRPFITVRQNPATCLPNT